MWILFSISVFLPALCCDGHVIWNITRCYSKLKVKK